MTDRDDVRRGYEAFADAYAAARSASDRELAVLDAFLASVPESARVLDAGCGQGDPILRRLREHVAAADGETRGGTTAGAGDETAEDATAAAGAAVGLDFSLAQLALAADAAPAAALVAGDLAALPFRADAFDAVVACDAIVHVPLDDHQAVVDEFARVLRPGGRLLLSEAPAAFERESDDWLGEGAEMTWQMAGADATREQLRTAGFRLAEEWSAPEPEAGEPPEPPFFEAVLAD